MVINEQKSAVEWLESIIFSMIMNGVDSDLIAVLEHCKKSKEIEKEQNIKSKIEAVNHFCKLNGFADTNMHKSVIAMYEKQLKKITFKSE